MDQIVKQDSSSQRMRDKAKQLLQEIDLERLPTLPNILLSLLKSRLDDPDSLEQFANHIDKDPALRIRLLSISQPDSVNTATETTRQMLERLDEHMLKNLAITSNVQQYFSSNDHSSDLNPRQNHFLKQHWQHALLCASIARAIAQEYGYQYPEEAYTAGLLHDIGQLVLHCAYPDIYATISAQINGDAELHDLESNEFSCNHLCIGAELLNLYHANSFFSDSILYHHEPIERIVDAHPLVRIVHLANQISNADFNQADKHTNNIFHHADQLLGLNRSAVIKILSDANIWLDECAVEFEIDLDDNDADDENARVIQSRAEYVQNQLNEQFKLLSLLDGLHQQLSRIDDERDLFDAIGKYSKHLFGSDGYMIFLYEASNNLVRNVAPQNNSYLNDLTIPLKENCSIISDCLLKKENLHSFLHEYNKLSIIDQQLLSSTSRKGLICLPLISHQQTVGVLVLAANRLQQASLWKQLSLLEYYTREIAHTIYARRTGSNKIGAASIDFETHIREVIHEVNNPLSIINNYLEILSLKLDKNNQAQTEIETIKGEIHRVSDILQRLKTPKSHTGNTEKTDVNVLINELTSIFKTSILMSNNVQLELDLDKNLTLVSCDADMLKQIYTNLIKNATEALPAKGKIMVYTQDQVNVDGKTFIEISVADNGPGIRPEVLSQLFKPVRTRKGDGHAGIGLSIVKKLVGELNGSISCRSSNRGTSFQILLPKK